MNMEHKPLRVLLMREGSFWVAQGLDINVAAQAMGIAEAEHKFCVQALGTIIDLMDMGQDWQKILIGSTDQKYHQMYAKGRDLSANSLDEAALELINKAGFDQFQAKIVENPQTGRSYCSP